MNETNPCEVSKLMMNIESLSMDFSTLANVVTCQHDVQNLAAIHQMTADGTPRESIAPAIRIIEEEERQDQGIYAA
jgi:hypothetical protein